MGGDYVSFVLDILGFVLRLCVAVDPGSAVPPCTRTQCLHVAITLSAHGAQVLQGTFLAAFGACMPLRRR
jgi:hypothetical protein